MNRTSSPGNVDLLFVALHQANLRCSEKYQLRYPMSRGIYFYDQYSRISHLGGIHRYKRYTEEFNQALHHVRIALTSDDNERLKNETPATILNPTPSPIKQQATKQSSNENLLRKIQKKFDTPIVPDVLFKELDSILQKYDDKSKTAVSSSTTGNIPSIADAIELEPDPIPIQEAEDEDELIAAQTNTPKVSLPGSLVVALHSTWPDLIANTDYKYKVWRTKAGEESWRRHVERKRLEQINADKQRSMTTTKQSRRRLNSRGSITTINTYSRQQPLTANPTLRSNRSLSRVSFLSANNIDHSRLLKPIHQGSLESLTESVKSGIHIEFKLSTQIDQQQTTNEQKGVLFDVTKPSDDVQEDVIALIQARCKRILADMMHKISMTANKKDKMCTIWFYGDNKHIRDKTNILTLNESTKRKRSNFPLAVLRKEIPKPYDVEIHFPLNKHKYYLELIDGSIQIYYPSGRLAVLRLPPSNVCTLFFDDTDIEEHQFLGCVTSNGSVFVMQPTLHARFTTDNLHERAYLCDGKSGIIEKQLQWHTNNSRTQSVLSNQTTSIDDDENILPPLFENTVQLQLNSSMQLEYSNSTNIRFAFACQKEDIQFELGAVHLTSQSPTSIDSSKKTKTKSNEIPKTTISDKQQIQIERLLDGQVNLKELPMIKDLVIIKKRVRHLCNQWLKEYRYTLGVMDIDSYSLPEWSSNQLSPSNINGQSKSAKSPRHITISSKNDLNRNEFLHTNEREQLLRTLSANKSTTKNLLTNTILEYIPRSTNGQVAKQKSSRKFFPSIKTQTILDESSSASFSNLFDLSFACPLLIRQRLIQNGPTSTILYDSCTCRTDQVPFIHDLEFDHFIQLTNHLNSKQLIVIGILNSNLREQTNDLYDILQTLHYHLNYGRSQICSCRLSTNDQYRCLIYDLAQATKQSSHQGPLLVHRHHVQPGFVLIYQSGKLIFGDWIFNGYGRNVQDLKKQLNQMIKQQIQTMALPDEFKFISDYQMTMSA